MNFPDALKGAGERALGAVLLFAGANIYATPVLAQSTPLPTREQVQPPVPAAEMPSSRARVEGALSSRELPCPFEAATDSVSVGNVRFTGVDGGALDPAFASILQGVRASEGPQPVAAICDIRDAATRALTNAGYVASVVIPPQEVVNGGDLSLSVIPTRLVEVEIEGRPSRYTDLIAARAQRLKGISPFNRYDAERVLLLAGDVPGLDVQLSLRPTEAGTGDLIGTLSVSYTPFSVAANLQNYSSRSLGRETAFLRVEAYGLTGMGDRTYVGGSSTFDIDEQQVVQIGHSLGIGSDGVQAEGNFTYAWSRPDLGGLHRRRRCRQL